MRVRGRMQAARASLEIDRPLTIKLDLSMEIDRWLAVKF
jgi:hypothetical protein